MALIGAILGDIAGSWIEFRRPTDYDWRTAEIFTDKCFITDDTVMSIATKYAIDNGIPYETAYRELGEQYPNVGYGGKFEQWLHDKNAKAYNSFGNGSAMRVSYITDAYDNIDDGLLQAAESAVCTHNHEEGIKGAIALTVSIYSAKNGWSKDLLLNSMLHYYPRSQYHWSPDRSLDDIRPNYKYDVTCQGTVPVAFRCFYESDSFESCLRNVLSLRGDVDTMAAIACPIAEEFYGETGFDNDALLRRYLDKRLYDIVMNTSKT